MLSPFRKRRYRGNILSIFSANGTNDNLRSATECQFESNRFVACGEHHSSTVCRHNSEMDNNDDSSIDKSFLESSDDEEEVKQTRIPAKKGKRSSKRSYGHFDGDIQTDILRSILDPSVSLKQVFDENIETFGPPKSRARQAAADRRKYLKNLATTPSKFGKASLRYGGGWSDEDKPTIDEDRDSDIDLPVSACLLKAVSKKRPTSFQTEVEGKTKNCQLNSLFFRQSNQFLILHPFSRIFISYFHYKCKALLPARWSCTT